MYKQIFPKIKYDLKGHGRSHKASMRLFNVNGTQSILHFL